MEEYELCAPGPYVVELAFDEAHTASRRICTILPDELLREARSQRPEPRQLIPKALVLLRVVSVVMPSIRSVEVCIMEFITVDKICLR